MSAKGMILTLCPPVLRPWWVRLEASPIGYRLAKGAFWSFSGAVISRALGILASIFVARMLGRTGFGELGIIQSTIGLFGIFAGFGLGITATKHVAEFRSKDPARAGRIIALSGLVAVASGGGMALVLFIFAPWLAEHTLAAPQLAGLVRIGSLLLFLSALNGSQTGALAGFEAFRTIARVNFLAGVSSFPVMVGGVWLWGTTGAVSALVVTMGVNWLLNHMALRRETVRHAVPFTLAGCTREWPVLWRFSLPAVASGAMIGPVTWSCNAMLVNHANGYSEMGLFNASNQWYAAIMFLPAIVAQAMLPMMSEQFGGTDGAATARTLRIGIGLNAFVCIPAGVILLILSPYIMALYGAEFEAGSGTMDIVVLTAMLLAVQAPVGQVIAASGRMWMGAAMNLGWAFVFLFSTYLLVSSGYGAFGLALGRGIAYLVHAAWTLGYAVIVLRQAGKQSQRRSELCGEY